MPRLKWKFYRLTICETRETQLLPATSDAIARDLACQRLAEDHWQVGDYSIQRESYKATEWTRGLVTIYYQGEIVATLRRSPRRPQKAPKAKSE